MVVCDTSTLAKVMTWINWLFLLGLGSYNVYIQFAYTKASRNAVNKLLACYIVLFAIFGALSEAGISVVHRNLKFLHNGGGKGVFFIFIGTLALAFCRDNDSSSDNTKSTFEHMVTPLIMGCFSIITAFFCFLDACCASPKDEVETRYKAADLKGSI